MFHVVVALFENRPGNEFQATCCVERWPKCSVRLTCQRQTGISEGDLRCLLAKGRVAYHSRQRTHDEGWKNQVLNSS